MKYRTMFSSPDKAFWWTPPVRTYCVTQYDNTLCNHIRRPNIVNSRDRIRIRGARQHNLQNVDLDIPRDKLVVFTGLSGSGKSSLAFDTIYAEGQRRYVESLSAYARMFLWQMDKNDVYFIDGLSQSISIYA